MNPSNIKDLISYWENKKLEMEKSNADYLFVLNTIIRLKELLYRYDKEMTDI